MTNEPTAEVPVRPAPGARTADGPDAVPGSAATATPVPASVAAPVPVPVASPVPGPVPTPVPEPVAAPSPAPATVPRRRRRWPVAVLVLLLLASLGAGGYLFATTRAYMDRLAWTEDEARAIGTDLVTTRRDLQGVTSELEAVREQLATAQERITALADEKAQIGDARETQAQLLDYQARVTQAAGTVASALERCVQGQDQLIDYLADASSYDPGELARFGQDVERLCRSASDANAALQTELANR